MTVKYKSELPTLCPDDYLTRNADFWKMYRKTLYSIITEEKEKIEKTEDNIVNLAKEIGIKPTARYFDIQPSQVRYYMKKQNRD